MRYPIQLLLLLLPFISQAQAKVNPCAETKIKGNSHQRSAMVSAAHTNLECRYDVHYYHLDVNVGIINNSISGNVLIKATALNTIDTFALELHPNLIVDSAKINGLTVPTYRHTNDLGLVLPTTAPNLSSLTVQVYYHGNPPAATSAAQGAGFSNDVSPSWGNRVTWSLTQPYSGHEWWPCKQDLTDKADSSEVDITTDSANMAGSNGLLKKVTNLPNHLRRFEWVNTHPINYYLISVSVAKYIDHSIYAHPAGSDSILFQNYIYNNPQTLQRFQATLDSTTLIIEQFSNYFGLYPFHDQKYGHCMAPISGGMEHQTMTTQGFFEFTIDAHELAHQWFGDYVTCSTWGDIWLNEGFASYAEYMSQEIFVPTNKANYMQNFQDDAMSEPAGSVYCTDTNSVDRIFDSRLTYAKGAAVIHTLRYLVNNDSLFYASLRNYLGQYANRTATTDQFHTAMEQNTGLNFNAFFAQWIYGEGFPSFNVKWKQTGDTLYVQNEEVTSTTVTPLFTLPIEYKITFDQGGDTTVKVMQGANLKQFAVLTNKTVTAISVDPNNWIMNGEFVQHDTTFEYVGIENIPAPTMQLFPNPVHDQLILKVAGLQGAVAMKMYNAEGRLLLEKTITNGNTPMNVAAFPAGTYLIKANGNVLRFVKE